MIAILSWLLVPLANAWWDRKGRKPNYVAMFFLRGIAMILHMGLVFNPAYGEWMYCGVLVLYYVTSYWIVFELALNIWQGKVKQFGSAGLLYYDDSEGDSGWLDKFFAYTGAEFHFYSKLFALALCIMSIFSIYHYDSY